MQSRKNFRFLSIGFVRVMASMQEIFNLMLARLVCLDNLVAMNAKTNFTSLADVFQAVDFDVICIFYLFFYVF